jgi:hypothetical protein
MSKPYALNALHLVALAKAMLTCALPVCELLIGNTSMRILVELAVQKASPYT